MPQRGFGTPSVGIVFDSDLVNQIDHVLALALLYGLEGKGECRVVATTVSKPNLKAAALCEVISRFYAGEVSAAFNASGRTLPVGLATGGAHGEDTPMLSVLGKRTAEGKSAYTHGIERLADTAEPVDVLRNALSAQQPANAIVVVTGPATNLARLLTFPYAAPLITERARMLVIGAGAYPEGKAEAGILADIPAARKLFAGWPGPIVAVGSEVGDAVPFPGAAVEKDFAWSEAHPVADAYKANGNMPYDAPTTAMAAVLYAVRSSKSPYRLSQSGTISVLDDGRTGFTPAPSGKHRFLIVDPTQKDAIQQTFVELASAKPVPRAPRFPRRPVQQEQQQQTPPPAQKKQ